MSDSTPFGFGKFVPGFDFLQNLATSAVKGASGAVPPLSHWVAPTLSVEELDKRISELKTVQFWLDQNATGLKATIQALEVQKMTLATLNGMNVSMGDLAKAFQVPPAPEAAGAAAPETRAKADDREAPAAGAAPQPGLVDPLQWWGSLTQQFQQIAVNAMQDSATQQAFETAQQAASGMAQEAMKAAAGMAASVQEAGGRAAPAGSRPAPRNPAAKKPAAKKSAAKRAPGRAA